MTEGLSDDIVVVAVAADQRLVAGTEIEQIVSGSSGDGPGVALDDHARRNAEVDRCGLQRDRQPDVLPCGDDVGIDEAIGVDAVPRLPVIGRDDAIEHRLHQGKTRLNVGWIGCLHLPEHGLEEGHQLSRRGRVENVPVAIVRQAVVLRRQLDCETQRKHVEMGRRHVEGRDHRRGGRARIEHRGHDLAFITLDEGQIGGIELPPAVGQIGMSRLQPQEGRRIIRPRRVTPAREHPVLRPLCVLA